MLASTAGGTLPDANQRVLAASPSSDIYIQDVATASLSPQAVGTVGGSQPHTNFQPYLCVDFIISLFGIFPSQT
jgi:microcystin-dependent protein